MEEKIELITQVLDNTEDRKIKNRLLDAAEELFCQKGFASTSIRDITKKANSNVASVNYHFGSKEDLYLAVFKRHLNELRERRISSINKAMSEGESKATLENLLREFSKSFIEPLVGTNRTERLITLVAREMLDPHLPKNLFYEEMIKPVITVMEPALIKLCPGLDSHKAFMSIQSVVGQLIHIIHTQQMFAYSPRVDEFAFDIDKTIEHIVAFSAAGIRSLAETKKSKNKVHYSTSE